MGVCGIFESFFCFRAAIAMTGEPLTFSGVRKQVGWNRDAMRARAGPIASNLLQVSLRRSGSHH